MPDTSNATPDVVFYNGRITTLDRARPQASAVAIKDGRFVAVGTDAEVMALAGSTPRRIDPVSYTHLTLPTILLV